MLTEADLAIPDGPALIGPRHAIAATVALMFLWLPLVFIAYAVGRRRFTLRFLLLLVTAESFALALARYMIPDLFPGI